MTNPSNRSRFIAPTSNSDLFEVLDTVNKVDDYSANDAAFSGAVKSSEPVTEEPDTYQVSDAVSGSPYAIKNIKHTPLVTSYYLNIGGQMADEYTGTTGNVWKNINKAIQDGEVLENYEGSGTYPKSTASRRRQTKNNKYWNCTKRSICI